MMGAKISLEDAFNQKEAYRTLLKLCKIGPRVSGTDAETRTVLLIEDYMRNAGLSSIHILGQEHQYYDAKKATIGLPTDSDLVDGVPCWMSVSTPSGGIKSESLYVGSYEMVENLNPKKVWNKIILAILDDSVKEAITAWGKLYGMNPAGVVFLDLSRDTAPRTFVNKTLTPFFSRTPSIVVAAKSVRSIHTQMFGTTLKLVVEGSTGSGVVQSIHGKLNGKKIDTVLICAHHDTYSLSSGATDNAAGVAIMLEIARILAQQDTNLSYQFVSFGGEELGMKGSWAYVSEVDLKDVKLCINLDSIGELPGMLLALAAGSDEMIGWLSNIASKNEYPARCRRTAISGGDNKVFAANGISTIHLASHGTTTGKVSHSSIDDASLLTPFTIGEMGKFAISIIEGLENSKAIPFNLEIPADLVRAAKQKIIDTRRTL
ncbi:MAG: M28 family metallopeptidase [Candidatus Thorarchaeota archaeon]|nr:M28 family metallopeptidase [Candidatus Thorarchaeota archaeon]